MSDSLFDQWFDIDNPDHSQVTVMTERNNGRGEVFDALVEIVADHLIDLEVIEQMGGFEQAVHLLKNRLPDDKKSRSGDLGEILATEFVQRKTRYNVPIRRLRYKDDRNVAMRGDDLLGFRESGKQVKVLKGEAKSRANLSAQVIKNACKSLAKHMGEPNPSTLAFIETILRNKGRDDEAEIVACLQKTTIRREDISHLIFTLSGNDPKFHLESACKQVSKGINLRLHGCRIVNHGEFVKNVFDACLSLGSANGVA